MAVDRIMFLSWGRRGAITALTRAVGRAALGLPGVEATISVSRQNEEFSSFEEFGDALFPIDTFRSGRGAAKGLWRVPQLRRELGARLRRDRTNAVVTLMPHVWTPFMIGAVRAAGARYATIVHDAGAHPGDPTALVNGLLLADARRADLVVTLSEAVRQRLVRDGVVSAERVKSLFHPDLAFAAAPTLRGRGPDRPFRLLFIGRIQRYKGLGLFVEAAELLRRRGVTVGIGVFGEAI